MNTPDRFTPLSLPLVLATACAPLPGTPFGEIRFNSHDHILAASLTDTDVCEGLAVLEGMNAHETTSFFDPYSQMTYVRHGIAAEILGEIGYADAAKLLYVEEGDDSPLLQRSDSGVWYIGMTLENAHNLTASFETFALANNPTVLIACPQLDVLDTGDY